MSLRFSINSWAAWAPGLGDQTGWRQWLAQPWRLPNDGMPALTEVPAMTRRRIERLGRAALQVAFQALDGVAACPAVFASRHGDMQRSIDLMRQLALESSVSPTAFSMSVHNAFAALFSITRADRSNYIAISAGPLSAENALVEAMGLLQEGASDVLVVYFDEALPPPLGQFAEDGAWTRAWACRIGKSTTGVQLRLGSAGRGDVVPQACDPTLPSDLELLRFLIGEQGSLHRVVDGQHWHWDRA